MEAWHGTVVPALGGGRPPLSSQPLPSKKSRGVLRRGPSRRRCRPRQQQLLCPARAAAGVGLARLAALPRDECPPRASGATPRAQVTWSTIRRYPSTLLVPVFVFLALVAVGTFAVVAGQRSTEERRRSDAAQLASSTLAAVLLTVQQVRFLSLCAHSQPWRQRGRLGAGAAHASPAAAHLTLRGMPVRVLRCTGLHDGGGAGRAHAAVPRLAHLPGALQ